MAAPIVMWVCDQFSRFGVDTSEESARYILSMEDAQDIEEYVYEILDKTDITTREFVSNLLEVWRRNVPTTQNVQVYKKSSEPESYFTGLSKKKTSPRKTESAPVESREKTSVQHNVETKESDTGWTMEEKSPDSQKKKQKFVPLFSQEGKARTTIQLPGRHGCVCQASKHKLINNCTGCGRVVCSQEGSGPCIFCGQLVCTKEEQEVLSRSSKKSEKLRQYLMGEENREYLPSTMAKMESGFEKAVQHKERLLEFDRTSASRTQVIDDESDYFATDSNKWLSQKDRQLLRKREEELREKRFGSRKDRKITLDFAGRRVLDAEENSMVYDSNDTVLKEVYSSKHSTQVIGKTEQLVNPTISQRPPKFVSQTEDRLKAKGNRNFDSSNVEKRLSSRLQDRELQEMCDDGVCLSMHQPWASLLVKGIKKHEGRTWYTPHRGRLWIAATAKKPDSQDIGEVEQFYKEYYNDSHLPFPRDYPVGCLLGCVDMTDCLGQEDYRIKFPEGESASPYVFICEHPLELVIKFPVKGKHKLYKLDNHIHQGAKKGLRDPTSI